MPWTAAWIDTIGDPTRDLRSNIAAEARAKIIYERLINTTPDPAANPVTGADLGAGPGSGSAGIPKSQRQR